MQNSGRMGKDKDRFTAQFYLAAAAGPSLGATKEPIRTLAKD